MQVHTHIINILSLDVDDGVVRISLVHHNTLKEVYDFLREVLRD